MLLLVQSLNNIGVRSAFMRLVILSVLEKDFVHVSASVLKQLIRAVENDECYFTVTEHTEFIGFLHQSKLSLCKSNLSVPLIHYACDLYFLSPHFQSPFLPYIPND